MKEEEQLLQAAWYEGCGRKTPITWQDLTEDGVLRENTGSLETKKLRDAYKEQLEETAGFADEGLWVAEGTVIGFEEVVKDEQKAGTEKRIYTAIYRVWPMRGSPFVQGYSGWLA